MYLEIFQEDKSYVKCSYHTQTNYVGKEEEKGKRRREEQTLGGDGYLCTQMTMMVPWVFVHSKLIKLCTLIMYSCFHVNCCSVAQLCLTPLDPISVLHYLPELAQIHVSDAIQPSHPLPPPSPFAFSLSQQPGLCDGYSVLQRRDPRPCFLSLSLSLPHKDTARRPPSANQEGSDPCPVCKHPDLQNWEKLRSVPKLPRLWLQRSK